MFGSGVARSLAPRPCGYAPSTVPTGVRGTLSFFSPFEGIDQCSAGLASRGPDTPPPSMRALDGIFDWDAWHGLLPTYGLGGQRSRGFTGRSLQVADYAALFPAGSLSVPAIGSCPRQPRYIRP